MPLHKSIQGQIKEAMMNKDALKLSVLRGLLAAFTNELVAKGKKPQDTLEDEEVLAVIKRSLKQRKDSVEQFRKGGREDLATSEESEMKVLESYLPSMMSKDEIRKIAEAKKAELKVTDKSGAGKLTGVVMKETKGAADGNDVREVVESLFS